MDSAYPVTGPVLILLFTLGAVLRITRLITYDTITAPMRHFVVHYSPAPLKTWMGELINCPWCVSMWVGFVVSPLAWFFGDRAWFLIPAMALSFSQVAGMVASRFDHD